MPVSKKRKRPERTRKRGGTDGSEAPSPAAQPASTGGVLTRMRGGFKNVAGAGPKKRKSPISTIVTLLLVVAAAYFVAKRFGIFP